MIGAHIPESLDGENMAHVFSGSDAQRESRLFWFTNQAELTKDHVANTMIDLAMFDPTHELMVYTDTDGQDRRIYELSDRGLENNLYNTVDPILACSLIDALLFWHNNLPLSTNE